MNRRLVRLVLIVAASYAPLCGACILQNGLAPYWPSSTIEVCFNAPSATERRNSLSEFNRAKLEVRRALTTLGELSDFDFTGFQTCSDENTTPRTAKIRVDLTEESVIPQAASIGPGAATHRSNLLVPYRIIPNGTTGPAQSINVHNMRFAVIHETMHLLGFQHEMPRDDHKYFASHPDLVVVGDYDDASAMHISMDEVNRLSQNRTIDRPSPFVSTGDRACLNRMARRQIWGPPPPPPVDRDAAR